MEESPSRWGPSRQAHRTPRVAEVASSVHNVPSILSEKANTQSDRSHSYTLDGMETPYRRHNTGYHAESDPIMWRAYNGDNYGDEWLRLAKSLRDQDEYKIRDCNDDIDTLMVFAGLFSAVLTAFVVESYKSLKLDSGDAPTFILLEILNRSSSNNSSVTSSQAAFSLPEFKPTAEAVKINALWFCSLILSLISASLGMLLKQWLHEYLAGNYTPPQERIRVRQYRYEGLVQWRVFEIASLLPVLLQVALVLFFSGISILLRQLNSVVGWAATILIIIWLCLSTLSLLAPTFSSRCPYKIPLLKSPTQYARQLLALFRIKNWTRHRYYGYPGDERGVRRDWSLDIPAIIRADESCMDDDVLELTIRPCLQTASCQDVSRFLCAMLSHRLDRVVYSLEETFDFERLTTKALYNSIHITVDALERELAKAETTLDTSLHQMLFYVFKALDHSYYVNRAIGYAMNRGMQLQSLLFSRNATFIQECLILMSSNPGVRCYYHQIDTNIADAMIIAAQDLLVSKAVDPRELCRVILSIASLQNDVYVLRTCKRSFQGLLFNLADAIQSQSYLRSQLTVSEARVFSSNDSVQVCVDLCTKLNERLPEFVSSELMSALGLM